MSLPYQLDNRTNDIKAKLWVIGIVVLFVVGCLHSIGTAVLLTCFGGFLLLELLDTSDGEFQFSLLNEDSGVALFKSKKTKKVEEAAVTKATFSWHYDFISGGDGISASGTTHITYIEVKLVCVLKDGRRILFLERLKPWQEIPEGWNYEIIDKEQFKDIRSVKGLLKFKKYVEFKL